MHSPHTLHCTVDFRMVVQMVNGKWRDVTANKHSIGQYKLCGVMASNITNNDITPFQQSTICHLANHSEINCTDKTSTIAIIVMQMSNLLHSTIHQSHLEVFTHVFPSCYHAYWLYVRNHHILLIPLCVDQWSLSTNSKKQYQLINRSINRLKSSTSMYHAYACTMYSM